MCGVDEDGVQHDEPNFAADMRELDEGRWIQIPDDDNGGVLRWWKLKAWAMVLSADFLAKKSLTPFSDGPSAHVFCDGCDFDKRELIAHDPCSFVRRPQAGTKRGSRAPFQLRTMEKLEAELDQIRKSKGKARTDLCRETGINQLVFPWHKRCVPSSP